MNQTHSRSNRRLFWRMLVFIVFCLLVGTIACIELTGIIFPEETLAPEGFPDAEIVFVAFGREVGFANADGTNPKYVHLVVKVQGDSSTVWPWRPVITGDNRTLIVKMADHVDFVYGSSLLALWRTDTFPVVCDNWLYQQLPLLTADQQHIFIQVEQGIAVYTLDSCGTKERPVKVIENVFGIPSPDFNYVAYTNRVDDLYHNSVIAVRNISSGEEQVVGEGGFPAWSRDGEWLAYTGPDGIYVLNIIDDIQPRRVILYPIPIDEVRPTYFGTTWRTPPEVSWSPDGQWLVYHKWTGTDHTDAADPDNYAIYKVNIETGEEIKIIDGGMYPYWRWPVEEP